MADDVLPGDESRVQPPARSGPAAPARPAAGGAVSPLRIYKPGQGVHVRWGTAIGGGLIALAGARWIHEQLRLIAWFQDNLVARTLVPVGLLILIAWLLLWAVGQNRKIVDFMIATEGEMKKVNWSSRREVLGATKVVIVTVIALSILLFVVDLIFMFIFSGIGVLNIPIWESLFGSPTQL